MFSEDTDIAKIVVGRGNTAGSRDQVAPVKSPSGSQDNRPSTGWCKPITVTRKVFTDYFTYELGPYLQF